VAAYIQSAWAAETSEHEKWDVRKRIHPYHICAWFDLGPLISQLEYQTTIVDVQEGTYGQTPLMYACRRGNIGVAHLLLGLGASVNACSDRGRTPLFEAVLRNKRNIVNLLLNPDIRGKEIDPKAINTKDFSRTALMTAIALGNSGIALAILGHSSASINMVDSEGSTALSLACSKGLTHVVEAILNLEDIDINHREKTAGRSPLILAAESNHWEVVKLLLAKGVDPNLKDSMGSTAATRAVAEGNLEVLKTMLDYEVDLFCLDEEKRSLLHVAADESHIDILELLHERGLPVNSPDEIGMIPIHCACRAGNLEVAQVVLSMGSNTTVTDHYGRTPAAVARQYGHAKLTHLFPGDDGSSNDSTDDSLADLPLWALVTLRRLDLIQSLISTNKADFSILEPGTNRTALHCALYKNTEGPEHTHNIQILKELLKSGIGVLDEVDRNLQTALHIAAAYNDRDAVKILLEHDPDVNAVDRFGLTPLIIAYKNSKTDLAIDLIEADAFIDGAKVGLQKLLFAAIQHPSSRAVQNLIKAGADVLAQDEYGRTALKIAKTSPDKNILNMVQSMNSFYHQVKRTKTKIGTTIQISTSEVVAEEDEEISEEIFDLKMPIRTFQSRVVDLTDMPSIPSDLPVLPTKATPGGIAVYA
jgi:ankyrin repeat protein